MKNSLQNSASSYCVKEQKPCIYLAERYFKDCLCNVRDGLSFGFGLMSLVCWGVAEIPQIITNFHSKSGHGVSLLFRLTWIAGCKQLQPPVPDTVPIEEVIATAEKNEDDLVVAAPLADEPPPAPEAEPESAAAAAADAPSADEPATEDVTEEAAAKEPVVGKTEEATPEKVAEEPVTVEPEAPTEEGAATAAEKTVE